MSTNASQNCGFGGRSLGTPSSLSSRRPCTPWMALMLAEQNKCGVGGRSSFSYSCLVQNFRGDSLGLDVGELNDLPNFVPAPPRQDTIGHFDDPASQEDSKGQNHRVLTPVPTTMEASAVVETTADEKTPPVLVSPSHSHDNSRRNSVATLEEDDDTCSSSESSVHEAGNNDSSMPSSRHGPPVECSLLLDLAEASVRNLTEMKRQESLSLEKQTSKDDEHEVKAASHSSRKRPRDDQASGGVETSSPSAEQRDVPAVLQGQPTPFCHPSVRLLGPSGGAGIGIMGIPLIPTQLTNGAFVLVPQHPHESKPCVSSPGTIASCMDDRSSSPTDKLSAHFGKRTRAQQYPRGTASLLAAMTGDGMATPNVLAAAEACAEPRGASGSKAGFSSGKTVGVDSTQRQQKRQKATGTEIPKKNATTSASERSSASLAGSGGANDSSGSCAGPNKGSSNASGSDGDKQRITKVAYDDYLTGKGGHCVRHAGNRMVRNMIESLLSKYVGSTSNKEKSRIVDDVVQSVFDRGGRFLERSGQSTWIELTQQRECRRRISQRFREVASGRSRTKSGRRRTTSTSFEYTPELPIGNKSKSHVPTQQVFFQGSRGGLSGEDMGMEGDAPDN